MYRTVHKAPIDRPLVQAGVRAVVCGGLFWAVSPLRFLCCHPDQVQAYAEGRVVWSTFAFSHTTESERERPVISSSSSPLSIAQEAYGDAKVFKGQGGNEVVCVCGC